MRSLTKLSALLLIVLLLSGCAPVRRHSQAEIPSAQSEARDFSGTHLNLVVLSVDDSRTVPMAALVRLRQGPGMPHWADSAFLSQTDGFIGLDRGQWVAAIPVMSDQTPQRLVDLLGGLSNTKPRVVRVKVNTDLPLYPQAWSPDLPQQLEE